MEASTSVGDNGLQSFSFVKGGRGGAWHGRGGGWGRMMLHFSVEGGG
jgi:hypothetical protein